MVVDGAQKVRIFTEEVAVKARIFTINGFPAHAGQSQLLERLGHFQTPGMQVFLIHGEYTGQQVLAQLIQERYGYAVAIPDDLEEIALKRGEAMAVVQYPEKVAPRSDWTYLVEDLATRLREIIERQSRIEARPRVKHTDLRDRLLDANRNLTAIISRNQILAHVLTTRPPFGSRQDMGVFKAGRDPALRVTGACRSFSRSPGFRQPSPAHPEHRDGQC